MISRSCVPRVWPSSAAPDPVPAQADLFARLARSAFRSRFHLGPRERAYCNAKGRSTIERHARDFVAQRIAPAQPRNDGKQTPMRGHPVFIAQHATACCCRSCIAKWHQIAAGIPLGPDEQSRLVITLMTWIDAEMGHQPAPPL
ncbi:DUF4186 domain-containing protein [Thioclava sp. GXIMD2076]|uniref:DUF4186 domain-containing protein n=1 Tax=Thioclava sp. GXIMD2076 TaxID=3131931 RepID=UPI0030D5966A